MGWVDVAKLFLTFLNKPTGLGALVFVLLMALLSYTVPLALVVGGFIYVGDKVVTRMEKGFERIETVLERRDIATRR